VYFVTKLSVSLCVFVHFTEDCYLTFPTAQFTNAELLVVFLVTVIETTEKSKTDNLKLSNTLYFKT
jgi:hypothetical protein